MITVTDLSKAYGRQVLFENAGFTINPGERVGLVGRNGTGKTTLFRMILGEEELDSGAISFPKGYTIRHLSQHIDFREDSILKEVCLEIPPHEDGRDETYKAKSILLGLGFSPDEFHHNPYELSGGFQVRLNLARVLVSEPNLLLLDEPTNYLDIVSVRWLTQFLRNWKGELMLVTHDRDFMDSITTHTMGIYRSKIRKITGPTHKLYDQILQEEEVYEKTRINEEKRWKEAEQFINRFRAQATRARAVQSRIKALQKKEKLEKITELKTLDFAFKTAPFHGKWVLEAENISFSFYPSSPFLIDGLSVAIRRKDRIGVIGKNGKGKTTLLNLFAGELAPLSGTITLHKNLKLAYFGQTNIDCLDLENTVEEEILSVHPEHRWGAARNICGAMMFDGDNALKKIGVLSGGEKSRVLLGKLLASPSNLLLLDEPTNHLDMESIDSLVEAMDAFEGAVMIVTHSEMILNAIATRLVVFDGGNVTVFEGTYQDFLNRVGWQDEEAVIPSNTQIQATQSKTTNRKEMRRLRAEIIADRSKVLNPLQQRIEEIEETIIRFEEQLKQDNLALMRAVRTGEGKSVSSLSMSIHQIKKTIESLFEELEGLTTTYHAKSVDFEEKLNNLL